MKCDVVVIGCGVVGAAIAYELAQLELSVLVVDAQDPGQGATGASLGVLMAVISQQLDGEGVNLRLQSLQHFQSWIPRLEDRLGRCLPVNRHGILRLLQPDEASKWSAVVSHRQQAGYHLHYLTIDEVNTLQPGLHCAAGGIYSPQDRQIDPRLLTHALIEAARSYGAQFQFHQPVTGIKIQADRINAVYTSHLTISAGVVVIAAGLGSAGLGSLFNLQIPVQPVKGQAVQVYSPTTLLKPVITQGDSHLVPLADGSLWIGATVEFEAQVSSPTLSGFQHLVNQALTLCPELAQAELRSHWSGQRPRPSGQRAPILGFSPLHRNVVLATGHYRNGVLLSPITAQITADLILQGQTHLCSLEAFQLKSQPTLKKE